ncbi:hypothetical protein KDH_08110 [Dictyobacter sp. S3.2.2.5]|uniref:Carrier domain-containing protein n=1 Tax=Dictyobacter halimunensis TaxID=3026934 RepID=A0ABQ6FJZ4_9CHLR|nr:hypothetical protein KDH_08110 [Dictyobacter sp. S3.2.2.5]
MNKKLVETMYMLSPAQQGMFYETVQNTGSGVHIEQFACTLEGELDQELFIQAWQQVTRYHAILRTAFVWSAQNEPVQVVMKQVDVPFQYEDWRMFSAQEQASKLEDFLQRDRATGFKLTRPPLMRLALLQTSDTTYEFVWTHHHILMDGWCCSLVQKDFLLSYEALSKGQRYQPAAHRPYRDYINWLKQQDESKAETFWRANLRGIHQPTPLGKSVPNPDIEPGPGGFGTIDTLLDARTGEQLQHLVRQQRLTLNTLFQGVWALLLGRYSQQADVLFGITVSGRPPELPGIESMVGLCINTLPVRVSLPAEQPLWSWLQQLQLHNLELRQFEYISGGKVHQWSQIQGGSSLYESLLVVENYPVDNSILQKNDQLLVVNNIRSIGAQTSYPLTVLVIPGQQISLRCVYDKQRLTEQTVQTIQRHFLQMLATIAWEGENALEALQQHIPEQERPVIRPLAEVNRENNQDAQAIETWTPLEEQLRAIWQEVLGKQNLSPQDNFFKLGGHSLLATQVIARIRQEVQLEVPLRALFEAPTIAALASYISRLQDNTTHDLTMNRPVLRTSVHTEPLPLSFAQQRLWFAQQLAPESSSYNSPVFVRIHGEVQRDALQRALNEIVRRHEVLRTIYREIDGQPCQIVMPAEPLALPYIDLRTFPDNRREQKALEFATQEGQHLFNLEQSPLIRTILLQLQQNEYVLLTNVHHIAFDAWSAGIFLREMLTLYAAYTQDKPSPLVELPAQYADFAHWQRSWLQGGEQERLIAYWQQQLRGAKALEMTTDRPRPAVTTFEGAAQPFAFSATLSQQLQALSQQEGVTLFMTLLAAFNILLYRITNQEDIVLGTDIANRTLQETELMIGFFVNLLVLRTNLGGKPGFQEVLKRVRHMVLDAYAHQDLPFEKLVDALHLERTQNYTPLVRGLFVMQNIPLAYDQAAGIALSPFNGELVTAKFDFVIFLFETEQGLRGSVNYSTELFNPETITTLMQRFEVLLQNIVANPQAQIEALDFYTEQEKKTRQAEAHAQNTTRRNKLKLARREEISIPGR